MADPTMAVNRDQPNIAPRLSIVDGEGKLVARLGGEAGPSLESGKFIAPLGLAVDSRGDIYVGEVSYSEISTVIRKYPITRPQARVNTHGAVHPAPISRARRSPRLSDVMARQMFRIDRRRGSEIGII
jgi:hypothetical protein